MHKRKAKIDGEEYNDTQSGHNTRGERGEREREGETERENEERKEEDKKEQRKYVVILNGLSVSFFQDTEIHLDLHRTTEAMSSRKKVEPVVFAVAVVSAGAVVSAVGGVCPGLELLPFLTVLRGVTSLPPRGGASRVARVVEAVTAVPLTRVPTRLWRCGALLPSPLAVLPLAEWFAGGPDRVRGAGAVPSAASGVVVSTAAAEAVVAVGMSGPLDTALGLERNMGSCPMLPLGSTRSVGT
ncbi:hypothetical protein EYF80_009732 [Liparis tanakae]|uniref:Uncharacterized protein n=1 Tax=Liparis tanakae TaxID=230148 RepID=A0A4Z2IPY9_9TELE|nr:hypothetical protein EYF80_009732 [Liparis tanakae]